MRYFNFQTLVASEPPPPHDGWLTVAEIAGELRVNPATVRLWISKELLPATRAGRRKLLIRRTDLDAMLRSTQDKPRGDARTDEPGDDLPSRRPVLASVTQIQPDQAPRPSSPRHEDPLVTLRGLQDADDTWARAQHASEYAPPDADFPHRIHALANAANEQSRALAAAAANARMKWKPTGDSRTFTISHELRQGGNRPGPSALWLEFDRCSERLGIAMEGTDLSVIASRWQDLSKAMHAIADALLQDTRAVEEGRR